MKGLARRAIAEACGTAMLLVAVVGSGIMAELSEAVATFGLLSVIWGSARSRPGAVAFAVAAYVTGAYWFTASTAFANPAVTLARAATDTFAGIRARRRARLPLRAGPRRDGGDRSLPLARAASGCACRSGPPGTSLLRGGLAMKTDHRPFKVLFLCTGNSARSVFAEYFLRRLGGARFESYSAGANPSGSVNPMTLQVLRERFGIDAGDARSKSWDELETVAYDFVITVCDNARETCPVWPGQPIIAHWGVEDPAAFVGPSQAKERFFHQVALTLYRRLQIFTSLPIEQLDRLKLETLTRNIGRDRFPEKDSAA